MVQLKGTSKYPCKAGTVVFFAVTGCVSSCSSLHREFVTEWRNKTCRLSAQVLGLGEMAVAVWLLVVTLNFYELLGFVVSGVCMYANSCNCVWA